MTDIHLTEEAPTDPRTILEFITEVEGVSCDEAWRPSFYEEMVANYEEAISLDQGGGPDLA